MHPMPNRLYRPLLLVILIALLIGGCTRISLVYRNLDHLIPWQVDDYVDMSPAQEEDFRHYLAEHLSWHCSTQLPQYLAWLDRLEAEPVTHENLRARYREAQRAMDAVAAEITPSTVDLLRRLDDDQVRELYAKLDKDHRERVEKYLEPTLDEQISERAERMRDRLDDWFGRLNEAQRERVSAWSQALGDRNARWLANRARWQQAFKDAIADRQAEDFPERIARLLQRREAFWTEPYRDSHAQAEQAGIDLAVDLYALADERQRQHLDARIEDIRRDLANLDCLARADDRDDGIDRLAELSDSQGPAPSASADGEPR
ncbi:DUF6279 family lipoprotein [Stutzerimonas urumqiensis]|uniref:DUF6279 family lipoprotein n=1 Tax=Stutzerimonas urumqiensis TaxID=638269 RepID=UPI0015A9FB97|nr:DUF6279 family lipoprotein [Stutzerimonas urumqiensis]